MPTVSFFFSCQELLTAAELQLECAEGVKESLFVTIKATLDENGAPLVDAWQVGCFSLFNAIPRALVIRSDIITRHGNGRGRGAGAF